MAEKLAGNTFEDLNCSICLDIFDDPTLLVGCGHTFCRKCLEEYYQTRRAFNYIECPLCKTSTRLEKTRIQGLPRNVSIGGLVDEVKYGQAQALLIKQVSKLCLIHKEDELFYCKGCNITMCSFCLGNGEHHNHEISKKEDIVKDVKKRVHNLSARCEERKATIVKEKNICEEHRLDLNSSAEQVQREISDAFDKKAAFIPQEKRTRLLKRAKSLQEFQKNKLDRDVAKHDQAINDIDKLFSELEDSSKMLKDGSMITICNVLSTDLDELLTQEASLQDTTEAYEETVKRLQFIPASKGVPALGTVRLRQEERLLRPKCSDSPDTPGNSSSTGTRFTLTVIRVISLSGSVQGMTAISEDTVLVGYGSYKDGSDCVCVSGKSEQHLPTAVGEVCDIATLTDGRSVVSQQSQTLRLFNPDGSPTGVHYTCKNGRYFLRICSDKDDNLYAVNGNPEIYIFRGKDPDPDESVIPTGDIKPEQICVMKSGAMVVITRGSKPGAVTLLDTSGHVITSITANHSHEHLYAAVDTLDRVFIASVRLRSHCLSLSMYHLRDRTLDKLMGPTDIPLSHTVGNMSICSLVCLTPSLLAFARQNELYFIEVT